MILRNWTLYDLLKEPSLGSPTYVGSLIGSGGLVVTSSGTIDNPHLGQAAQTLIPVAGCLAMGPVNRVLILEGTKDGCDPENRKWGTLLFYYTSNMHISCRFVEFRQSQAW